MPQVQTFDDLSYLLYVGACSSRKWGAIKRKAKVLGMQVVQDGDDEGCKRAAPDRRHEPVFAED